LRENQHLHFQCVFSPPVPFLLMVVGPGKFIERNFDLSAKPISQ
jgi:hypothetical protein